MIKRIISKTIDILYYVIIPFLIIGITLNYTTFQIALVALLVMVILNNRHSVGVFFIMYGGSIAGITRTIYPNIPVYGVVLGVIGFLLIWDLLLDFFKTHWTSLLWLGLLLVIFGIFYLMGPRDEFAQDKYSSMCIHATLMLFGYYVINKSTRINAEGLTRLMLLGAICMYAFGILFYHFSPGDFFDYDWFRDQLTTWQYDNNNEDTIVNYQHIGMMVLYGIAIYLSQTHLPPVRTVFYLVCASQLVLMSGCRQAMLGLFVVVVLRFVVLRLSNNARKEKLSVFWKNKINLDWSKRLSILRNSVFGKFVSLVVGLVAAYFVFVFIISKISSDIVDTTLESGEVGRQFLFVEAIAIFKAHPLLGSGIGGFHFITGEVWPHNFFLELLCETGWVGTLIFLVIVVFTMAIKHIGLFHVTNSNMFYFLILSALFVRIMVSSDLPESIELFSAVFAVSAVKKTRKIATYDTIEEKS